MSAAAALAEALRADGGLLADALPPAGEPLVDEPLLDGVPPGAYALTLAAVREGYLLHYGRGRLVATGDDDLALLGGDRLYALGLATLAEHGDLVAVARLADLISQCAQAHAEGDPVRAESAWAVTASALAR